MLLHTITLGKPTRAFSFLRFMYFVSKEIFPGGELPAPEQVIESARAGGFEIEHVESLRPHYVLTLERWLRNLKTNRDRALELVGEDTFQAYQRYLSGSARSFRTGEVSVHQFKVRAQ
jgi:cyclopropane-fatty-acyl-phospholipid synthase